MGVVDVKHTGDHELTLEWESSSSNDMIADSTLALITGIDTSPASVKCRSLFVAGILIHAHLHPSPPKYSNNKFPFPFTLFHAYTQASTCRPRRQDLFRDTQPTARDVPRGPFWRGRTPYA